METGLKLFFAVLGLGMLCPLYMLAIGLHHGILLPWHTVESVVLWRRVKAREAEVQVALGLALNRGRRDPLANEWQTLGEQADMLESLEYRWRHLSMKARRGIVASFANRSGDEVVETTVSGDQHRSFLIRGEPAQGM